MTELAERIAALPPEKRRLLERRMKQQGLARAPGEIPRRATGRSPYPLSFGQQRLWFIERLTPGTAAYHIPFAGRLRGALDPSLLAASLDAVMRRHDVLRSRFLEQDGRPVQVIDPEPAVRVPVVDLRALPGPVREAEGERITRGQPVAPFDLARGPVLRVTLVQLGSPAGAGTGPDAGRDHAGASYNPWLATPGPAGEPAGSGRNSEHLLLVTMHHIVTDAWSMAVFFRELPAIYDAARRGERADLPPLPVQVADVALWEREQLQGEALERRLAYWRTRLAGVPTVLELPTDRPRPPVFRMRGRRHPLSLPPPLARVLREMSDRRGLTLFHSVLAAWGVLLMRFSGQGDLLVGSPVATRSQPETYGLIGFFLNTAVLRLDLKGDPTFAELLERVRAGSLADLAHQDLPFERLAEVVEVPRDLSRPPLVQVNFVFQNVHIPQPAFADITLLRAQQTDTGNARFDLALGVFEEEGVQVPQGGLEYNSELFDPATAVRLAEQLLVLMAAAVAEPEVRVGEVVLLPVGARQQVVVEWGGGAASFPAGAGTGVSLVERWAALAAAEPEAVAVVAGSLAGERRWTRGVLAARAGRMMGELARLGVGLEDRVAVCLGPSPELVATFLGVLAAGGAYLPLDPTHPARRLAGILRDARPAALVTTADLAARLGSAGCPVVLVAAEEDEAPGMGSALAPRPVPPEAAAYVIHTSGSTGRPKGVVVPRRALEAFAAAQAAAVALGPVDRVLQSASPGFDASIWEMVAALAAGAELHQAGREDLRPGPGLAALLCERAITLAFLNPAALGVTDEGAGLPALRHLFTGGEACPPEVEARWRRDGDGGPGPGRRFWNAYGPTEATICATLEECRGDRPRPPIGRPLPGVRALVLDRRLKPVPIGVAGELCLGGATIARGYLGRPDLTAAAFLPDASANGADWNNALGARLYRTGDLVRLLPDGRLDFLGRVDRQVQVRGQRVEPGEVEAALAAHPRVAEAAVGPWQEGRLAAWVVPARPGEPPHADELRAHLRERLPDVMIPTAWVVLEALPRTPAGKLDRRALPPPGRERPELAAGAPRAPRTPAEAAVASLFRDLLGLAEVGVDDDFFDLGGDSILGIQLVARAAEAGLYLDPRHLYEQSTVAGLAAAAADAPRIAAEQGAVTGPVPLTPVQRSFFELDVPHPAHWNLALLLAAPRHLDLRRLAGATAALLAHHDQLRARFRRGSTGWRQELALPGGPVPAHLLDLSSLPAERRSAALQAAAAAVQTSLDLDRGPLLRAVLFGMAAAETPRLLLAAHHLVIDAISWRIVLEDLHALTAAPDLHPPEPAGLPPKTTSFRTWAERLAAYGRSAEVRQELALWQELARPAAGAPPSPPDGGLEREASQVEVGLDAAATRALLEGGGEARPEERVLAALAAGLAAWPEACGEGALRIDVEGHGREPLFEDVDLSRTVGWFTVVHPLRLEIPAGTVPPAEGLLGEVRAQLHRAPHRGLGWGVLRHLAGPEAAAALAVVPPAEVSFNYMGRVDAAFAGWREAGVGMGQVRDPAGRRLYALEVVALVRGGELRLHFVHGRRFERAAVERLAAACRDALAGLAASGALAPEAYDPTRSGLPSP